MSFLKKNKQTHSDLSQQIRKVNVRLTEGDELMNDKNNSISEHTP